MPLSSPTERTEQHTRTYDFRGYERKDGLWDIEGRLMDVKTYSFRNEFRGEIAPGDPVHDMWIRLTITEDFEVKAIEVVTDKSPFAICPAVAPNFQRIVGTKIGMGWKGQIRKLLAGSEGCTHLVEMLGAMATVAYQALYPKLIKKRPPRETGQKPALLNTCHAFSSDGDIARKEWPEFYTGD